MISKEIEKILKEKGESFIFEFEYNNKKYIQTLKPENDGLEYFYYRIDNNKLEIVEDDLLFEFTQKYEISEETSKKKRIENPEIKQWIKKFAIKELNGCKLFTKVYGKKTVPKKLKRLNGISTKK